MDQNVTVETGSNFTDVTIGSLTLYFSYQTCIGFTDAARPSVISENCWGQTTGKHLNAIDGGNKKSRLDRIEFEKALNQKLVEHGLA